MNDKLNFSMIFSEVMDRFLEELSKTTKNSTQDNLKDGEYPYTLDAYKDGLTGVTRGGDYVLFRTATATIPQTILSNLYNKTMSCDSHRNSYMIQSNGTTGKSTKNSDYDIVKLIDRHYHLKNQYKEGQIWEILNCDGSFGGFIVDIDVLNEPKWIQSSNYQLSPLNDAYQHYKNGGELGITDGSLWTSKDNKHVGDFLELRVKNLDAKILTQTSNTFEVKMKNLIPLTQEMLDGTNINDPYNPQLKLTQVFYDPENTGIFESYYVTDEVLKNMLDKGVDLYTNNNNLTVSKLQ